MLIKRNSKKKLDVWLAPYGSAINEAKIYKSWLEDPRVHNGIGGQDKYAEQEVIAMLKELRENPLKMHWFVHLFNKGSLIPVGDFNLNRIIEKNAINFFEISSNREFDFKYKNAEVAIMLGGDYHERGIGPLVVNRGIKYAFDEAKIDCLWASIYADNEMSIALFKKAGFKETEFKIEKVTKRKEKIFRLKR